MPLYVAYFKFKSGTNALQGLTAFERRQAFEHPHQATVRGEYWVKGQTSGHTQQVREVRLDCDGDALLLLVDQQGPACHTGLRSCFDTGVLT